MAHSYSYLARKAGLLPAKSAVAAPVLLSYKPPRYVRFYMPAIPQLNEPSETRLVGFHSSRDTDWIADMSTNYAVFTLGRTLTTFFPDHP